MRGTFETIEREAEERAKTAAELDNWTPPAKPSQAVNTNDSASTAQDGHDFSGPEAWPEPEELPEGLPSVPQFDIALLPNAFRPWITDICDRVQCPPDYPAVGVMVALATVIGRQVAIRPRLHDDWTVVPNLWGALIGRSGLLKSPALGEVMRPLEKLEAQARESYEEQKADYDAQLQVGKAEAKKAEKDIQKAIDNGNNDEAQRLAKKSQNASPEAPVRRRYYTSDPTVEALGELLSANPRGVLVHRDELRGWLKNLDKPGREGDRAFYLEAWNGTGSYTYDRIGRGTLDIEAACVSVLGSIQPGPLHSYIRQSMDSGEGADGLMQRIQLAVWPDFGTEFEDHDRPPDKAARDAAGEVFQRLDNIDATAIGADCDEGDDLPYLRFNDEALATFREWRKKHEERVRKGEEHPAFEAVLSKHRSLVPSIALISHLADNPDGGPVKNDAVLRAIAWSEYLEEHARRIYAPALDPRLHAARELDRHIRNGDLGQKFRARDVYLKEWRALDRQGTEDALTYLAELGRVVEVKVETTGRPATFWYVNPKVEVSS